jgi:hypothetical protein
VGCIGKIESPFVRVKAVLSRNGILAMRWTKDRITTIDSANQIGMFNNSYCEFQK